MTVANALKAIESVADTYGDKILLGAGTVLDPETARDCMLAGAQFFVTPCLNHKTIELARRYSRPHFSWSFDSYGSNDSVGGRRRRGKGFSL